MSEGMPKKMAGRMAEDMPERTPEDLEDISKEAKEPMTPITPMTSMTLQMLTTRAKSFLKKKLENGYSNCAREHGPGLAART